VDKKSNLNNDLAVDWYEVKRYPDFEPSKKETIEYHQGQYEEFLKEELNIYLNKYRLKHRFTRQRWKKRYYVKCKKSMKPKFRSVLDLERLAIVLPLQRWSAFRPQIEEFVQEAYEWYTTPEYKYDELYDYKNFFERYKKDQKDIVDKRLTECGKRILPLPKVNWKIIYDRFRQGKGKKISENNIEEGIFSYSLEKITRFANTGDSRYLTESKNKLSEEKEQSFIKELNSNFNLIKDELQKIVEKNKNKLIKIYEKNPDAQLQLKALIGSFYNTIEEWQACYTLIMNSHIFEREKSLKKTSWIKNDFTMWSHWKEFTLIAGLTEREWKIFFNTLKLRDEGMTAYVCGNIDQKIYDKLKNIEFLDLTLARTDLYVKDEYFYVDDDDFVNSINI
jgi:hypothetical protein